MQNLSNDIFAKKLHDRASQRRLLARCCMNPQRRQAEVKKPVLRLPMRMNADSKVVNKYLSADWAAGVGWRVPKRCPLSGGVHPRAGVKRTRASVRRVRRNADAKVVNHFFREKWQRQAAAGSVWQWHPSVSGLGRKRGVMVAAMPVNPRLDGQTNDECAVRTA